MIPLEISSNNEISAVLPRLFLLVFRLYAIAKMSICADRMRRNVASG